MPTYADFPSPPTIPVASFVPHVPDAAIADLHARLANAAPRKVTWDNSVGPKHLGVHAEWFNGILEQWKVFDWRAIEAEIASFPSFLGTVQYKGHEYKVHFLALFSSRPDAVPIVFNHGWPSSVLEFTPMLRHARDTYTPSTLPHHLIVPALVGYGWSTPPATDAPFSAYDNASIVDSLMRGLGFGKTRGGKGGYIGQGGDIGSFVTRHLSTFDDCRAIHLNFLPVPFDKATVESVDLDEFDRRAIARANKWNQWGLGYLKEHATKPGTIGAVLESSPVALMAWLGEKFESAGMSTHFILAEVSLFWYSGCVATSLWEYRAQWGMEASKSPQLPKFINKPTGYSQFINEIVPTPIPIVGKVANLVWAKRHDKGGHFAPLDVPVPFWEDMVDFGRTVVKNNSAKL